MELPKLNLIGLESKNTGNFILYSEETLLLYKYSINGKRLHQKEIDYPISCLNISRDSKYLITGGIESQSIIIRTMQDLSIVALIKLNSPVYSFCHVGPSHFMVGTNGNLLLLKTKFQ